MPSAASQAMLEVKAFAVYGPLPCRQLIQPNSRRSSVFQCFHTCRSSRLHYPAFKKKVNKKSELYRGPSKTWHVFDFLHCTIEV